MTYDAPHVGQDAETTDVYTDPISGGRHTLARSPDLENVFDDPEIGQPGRDRFGIHFAWEGVLAVGVIALGFLLWTGHKDAVSATPLQELLVFGSALGLLALAAAMTLRAGVPNLAIGPIAIAASFYYAMHSAEGALGPVLMLGIAGLAAGVVLAVLIVGFHVPGWLGSLVLAMAAIVWIQLQPASVEVAGAYSPYQNAVYLFAGFVAVSVLGGLLALIKPVRRGVGRFRPVGDPAVRRGGAAAAIAVLALVASCALAGGAGVLFAAAAGASGEMVTQTLGLELTGLAFGAALAGGASAYGRRGGVFGTVLGTVLIALLIWYGEAADWRISVYALAAGALLVGLIVTRLVETFGRPLAVGGADDWSDVGVATGEERAAWSTGTGDTWSSLPAQPAANQWGDDRWR